MEETIRMLEEELTLARKNYGGSELQGVANRLHSLTNAVELLAQLLAAHGVELEDLPRHGNDKHNQAMFCSCDRCV